MQVVIFSFGVGLKRVRVDAVVDCIDVVVDSLMRTACDMVADQRIQDTFQSNCRRIKVSLVHPEGSEVSGNQIVLDQIIGRQRVLKVNTVAHSSID